MAVQAAITLNTVVYDPNGAPSGKPSWVNRASGLLGSFSKVVQDFTDSVGKLKLTRVNFKLEVPVVATVDTACVCAGTTLRLGTASVTFTVAPDSTLAERTDLYLRLKDLVATDLVKNSIENYNPAYA